MKDLMIIAALFYLLIILHEFFHFLGFKVCGLEIKFFYAFPIVFIYNTKVVFKLSLYKGFTGLVVPRIPDEIDKNTIKKKILIGLAMPVLMHVIFMVICGILFIITRDEWQLDFALINLFFLLSTTIKKDNTYGDTLAIYQILKNTDISEKIIDGIKEFKI